MAGSMKPMNRITPSLWASWYYWRNGDGDFLATLRRDKVERTEAMQKGIDFENDVVRYNEGGVFDAKYRNLLAVERVAGAVKGMLYQVDLRREITIDGITYQLNGISDFIGTNHIVDVKYTESEYDLGDMCEKNAGHLFYPYMANMTRFRYLISNGKWVIEESVDHASLAECAAVLIENRLKPMLEDIDASPEMRLWFNRNWLAKSEE